MEAVCRLLSRTTGPVVTIRSRQQYELAHLGDLFFKPVGDGEFGCCAMNHCINGVPIPCDRARVSEALGKLVQKLLLHFDRIGDEPAYHFLRTMWPHLFEGLPMPSIDVVPPKLSRLARHPPLPPLFYEVMSRNIEGVKRLVEGRADVNDNSQGSIAGGLQKQIISLTLQ